jgi:Carboxypeptidase regulatory-like domain
MVVKGTKFMAKTFIVPRVEGSTGGASFRDRCSLMAVLLVLLAVPWTALAQSASIYSSIVGTVTDSTGAAVPDALVTVTNPATGGSFSAKTNDQGLYRVDSLVLGTYNLHVQRQGFAELQSNGLMLSSGQELRADYSLQVGSAAQSITVETTAPMIDLQNAQLSNTFDFNVRKYLPVSVPSGTVLPDLSPAVTLSGTNQNVFSFAGSLQNEYDYQIDGISFTKNGIPAAYTEWMQEEKIDYVNNNAQYQSQAVLEATFKSGSNTWHGSAVDIYTSGGLSSKNTFSTIRPSFVRNIFASSVSGPIIKDRLFFYGGVAGSRVPGTSILAAIVPTAAQLSGNFGSTTIIDPQTGQPFPGNVIPANRISSVASTFAQEFYPPVTPGLTGANNFQTALRVGANPEWNPYVRVDYKISQKNSLYGDWIREGWTAPGVSGNVPATAYRNLTRNDNLVGITDVEAFSPNLLNEFGIGYARDYIHYTGENLGPTVVQKIGLQGVSSLSFPGVPSMQIAGFTTVTQSSYSTSTHDTYSVRDTVTWIRGRHTMKFGGAFSQDRSGSYPTQPDNLYGTFSFAAGLAGGTTNALANFLLGLPSTEGRQLEFNRQHFPYKTAEFFAQDSIEASRRLTIDVGLRYEYHQPPFEPGGQAYNVNLATGNIILYNTQAENLVTPQVLNNPAFTFQTSSAAGYPGHLYSLSELNFAPRLGVAYRLDEKSVVRSGYGIFYDFAPPQATPSDLFNVVENFNPNTITRGVPAYQFPNPFAGASTAAVGTLGLSSYAKNLRMPYTQQWSLTLERQFIPTLAVRVSYIGSHTAEQMYAAPANIPAPSTTTFTQAKRPLIQYGQMTAYKSGADANYNGLSMQAQYRSTTGIYASYSFTWARNLGIAGQNAAVPVTMNPFNLRQDYGNTINPTLVSTGVFSLPIPIGRERRYFASMNRIADSVLGGWNLTSSVILRSGDHLTPLYTGYDSTGTGITAARPDVIGNPNLPKNQRGTTSTRPWFNKAAFAYPGTNSSTAAPPSGPIGRFGNAGVGIIEGPGYEQVDLGVAKQFTLYERYKLNVFALGNNAFNHPSFGDPNLTTLTATTGTITALKPDQDAAVTTTGGTRQLEVGVRFEF